MKLEERLLTLKKKIDDATRESMEAEATMKVIKKSLKDNFGISDPAKGESELKRLEKEHTRLEKEIEEKLAEIEDLIP